MLKHSTQGVKVIVAVQVGVVKIHVATAVEALSTSWFSKNQKTKLPVLSRHPSVLCKIPKNPEGGSLIFEQRL